MIDIIKILIIMFYLFYICIYVNIIKIVVKYLGINSEMAHILFCYIDNIVQCYLKN